MQQKNTHTQQETSSLVRSRFMDYLACEKNKQIYDANKSQNGYSPDHLSVGLFFRTVC